MDLAGHPHPSKLAIVTLHALNSKAYDSFNHVSYLVYIQFL